MNRKCNPEQIKEYVKRYFAGEQTSEIIREAGVSKSTLYRWIKVEQEARNKKKPTEFSLRKFRDLEQKVKRQAEIIEILKKVECTVQAPLQTKLREMEKLYSDYSVHALCNAMDVSRGTFYNHILRSKGDNSSYAKRRDELKDKIFEVYNEYNQIFGAAKISAVLRERGIKVSEEMTRILMRKMGLISMRDGAKDMYDHECRKYKNIIKQNFDDREPNRVWVGDVTQFRYEECTYYLSVVIDLFSRRVVGYKIGLRNSANLIKASFKMAYEDRKPEKGIIFHSDRCSNYRSKAYCEYLQKLEVQQSFSRAHVPYDNSVVESFFASLKREELYRTKYRSEREFKEGIEKYIVFYNEERPHATFRYKTPAQAEAEYK